MGIRTPGCSIRAWRLKTQHLLQHWPQALASITYYDTGYVNVYSYVIIH